jgi:CelD/BcsL family acetyltransferase involved in cellulose biosynthesis
MAGQLVEGVDVVGAEARADAWRDLCGRALEANAFAEPGFLAAAGRHIAPPNLEFLFVWTDDSRERLIGLMAMAPPRLGVAEIWQSEQAGLPAFVLDREVAATAFDAATQWLRQTRPRIAGLFVPTLAANGETARLVESFGGREGLIAGSLNPRQRAILSAAGNGAPRFEQALNGKRVKEWRRLRRRLEERGPLVLRSVQQQAELQRASEDFLALETKSWKGRAGAPLGADPARGAFARSMLKALAEEGKLRISVLELAGAPIAMGVVLSSNDRAFYWKTAYDEAFAEFSPGVLLTLDLSRALEDDPRIAMTDSCAIEGHPMIERLWPQRIALVDRLIELRPGGDWRIKLWLAERQQTHRFKELAKRALFPLLGRKRS